MWMSGLGQSIVACIKIMYACDTHSAELEWRIPPNPTPHSTQPHSTTPHHTPHYTTLHPAPSHCNSLCLFHVFLQVQLDYSVRRSSDR